MGRPCARAPGRKARPLTRSPPPADTRLIRLGSTRARCARAARGVSTSFLSRGATVSLGGGGRILAFALVLLAALATPTCAERKRGGVTVHHETTTEDAHPCASSNRCCPVCCSSHRCPSRRRGSSRRCPSRRCHGCPARFCHAWQSNPGWGRHSRPCACCRADGFRRPEQQTTGASDAGDTAASHAFVSLPPDFTLESHKSCA